MVHREGVQSPRLARRSLVNWLLGMSGGALGIAIVYPVARYLIPPPEGEARAASVTLKINPATVEPNSGDIFRFGSRPGILIRTPGGELRAFSAVCTHLACTVHYRPDLSHIWFACHNGHYDLNGTNIAGRHRGHSSATSSTCGATRSW